MSFLELLTRPLVNEVNHAIDSTIVTVQRRLIRMVLKAAFAVFGVAALALGLILFGAQYVGADLMLLLTGVLMLFGFLLL